MKQTLSPVILDAASVEALLPQLDVQAELLEMFKAMGQGGAVQPAQTVTEFPGNSGDFITYLGAVESMGVFGTKLSPYIVTDAAPIITAWTALMSMQTGEPLVWCDAGRLTTERTAATTALAVDFLASKAATNLAIIGSGAVAQAHLRHVLGLRDWERISVYSPSLAQDLTRQAEWRAISDKVQIAQDAETSVSGADVVMLCTSSGVPVLDPLDIGQSALITSISTNAPNAHEVPPAFLCNADVYCDYAQTTPSAAAEMRLATAEHAWSAEQIRAILARLPAARPRCPPMTSRFISARSGWGWKT